MSITSDITSYLTLGKSVGESPEILQFKNLVAKIYNKAKLHHSSHSVQTTFPFIFICGSSGTGKTQIPFSLPHTDEFPFIYFLQNPRGGGGQTIYEPFVNVSKAFENFVRKDFDSYAKKFENSGFSELTIYQCSEILEHKNMKFYSIGFIVKLFREICKQRVSGESWIKSELRGFEFSFDAMSIQEGIDELCSIRKEFSLPRPPIIFLDESSVEKGQSGIFQFRRNILRLLNLVVVLMGTDAAASNFVGGRSNTGSRTDEKDWCHIFFKLAPTVLNI